MSVQEPAPGVVLGAFTLVRLERSEGDEEHWLGRRSDRRVATSTGATTMTELPRGFVVGLHRAIPLALHIDGGTKLHWRPTTDRGASSP